MWKWVVTLAAPLLLQAPVTAAAPAEQAIGDPFEQMLDAMGSSVSQDALLASYVRALETTLRLHPRYAAMERQRPGTIGVISAAALPTLESYSKRVRDDYRPRFLAVLRERLTAEEALEIADFMQTPIARTLLDEAAGNFEGRAAGAAMASGSPVTSTDVSQDARVASLAALDDLDEAEWAEARREARSHPAMLKLGRIRADFIEIRTSMGKESMTAAEHAMLAEAIQAAFAAR